MATIEGVGRITLEAGETFASKQFYIAFQSNDGKAWVANSMHGKIPVGIVENKPASGEAATVIDAEQGGIAKVALASTVTNGQWVGASADGRAYPATGTEQALGQVLAAGAAGEVVPIRLHLRQLG